MPADPQSAAQGGKPAPPPQQPQQPPPPDQEHAALAVIVLALMAGGSIKLMTSAIEAVLAPLGIRGPAIEVTLELVVPHLPAKPTQQFGGAGKGTAAFDLPPQPRSAQAFVERTRWARSAAYVLNGSRRVAVELDQAGAPPRPPLPPSTTGAPSPAGGSGEPGPAESLIARTRGERVQAFGEGARDRIGRTTLDPSQPFPTETAPLDRALERERRYFAQHLNAERARVDAARRVDATAAQLKTTVLGWYATLDGRTTLECRAAHSHNFDVARPPAFGYPGTLHGGTCRCRPGPPFPGQSSVDEFVQTVAGGRGIALSRSPVDGTIELAFDPHELRDRQGRWVGFTVGGYHGTAIEPDVIFEEGLRAGGDAEALGSNFGSGVYLAPPTARGGAETYLTDGGFLYAVDTRDLPSDDQGTEVIVRGHVPPERIRLVPVTNAPVGHSVMATLDSDLRATGAAGDRLATRLSRSNRADQAVDRGEVELLLRALARHVDDETKPWAWSMHRHLAAWLAQVNKHRDKLLDD